MTTPEHYIGFLANLGREIPSLCGTCELEGITGAMLFRWERKPELSANPPEGGGSCSRSPGEVEAKWVLSSHSSSSCPLSLPSAYSCPAPWPLQGEETPLCDGCCAGLLKPPALGNNLKGSHVLLCSHWKPIYLFIMFEKSLQYRKEMLQSTEFYFHCRFILIPCGFPQASCLSSVPSVESQLFCRMTPSEPPFNPPLCP